MIDDTTIVAGAARALLDEAGMLRRLPGFEAAVRAYAGGIVRWREEAGLLNKLAANEARMRATGYLLYLSAADRVGGGEGGVAYGTLYALCVAQRAEVSPRVLKTMLALLQFTGLVDVMHRADDRRIKLYRPRRKMLDFARLSYGYAAQALDVVVPGDRVARLAADESYLLAMLATAGADHAISPPSALMPDFIGFIGQREGAGAVLAALTVAEMDGSAAPSRAALAGRLFLSKAQVNRVISEGAARGYLAVNAQGVPTTTAAFAETYRQWIAIELAFMARHL